MPYPQPQLEWSVVHLGSDLNWWIEKISDELHWDIDGLGIIDPRQISHIVDLCEPLRDYGFDPTTLDAAFFKFRIEKELKNNRIRLARSRDSLIDSEDQLFALPDNLDEEKGPYADFLEQITTFRVKLLNDLIDLEQILTTDELEEEIRERQSNDILEGDKVHFFNEVTAILEYVPEGFEIDLEDDSINLHHPGENIAVIPDFPETEEKIVEDETMKWEYEEEETEEELEDEDDDLPEEEPAIQKPKRGRPRKS